MGVACCVIMVGGTSLCYTWIAGKRSTKAFSSSAGVGVSRRREEGSVDMLSKWTRSSLMAMRLLILWLALCCVVGRTVEAVGSEGEEGEGVPHVFIAVQTRSSAYLLPNFFGYLENLDYPKKRMSIWVRTDHNLDDTASVLETWCAEARKFYLSVECYSSEEIVFELRYPYSESDEQYLHMAMVQQEALDAGRRSGAKYIFVLNTDNYITNSQTLRLLIDEDRVVVAPMLSSAGNAAFSNFWMDQDTNWYYKRHDDYLPILQRNYTGCFKAPVLLPPLLIDLSSPKSLDLVYHPPPDSFDGPIDDIIHFAYSARISDVPMFICNSEPFGYIIRPHSHPNLNAAASGFLDFKLKTLVNSPPVLYSKFMPRPNQVKGNMGFDAVYMIGLARRPERRNRMNASLLELGFDYTLFDAVDGRKLNASYVEEELGIRYMSNWRDPWGNRTMTLGEVGCFLSHYTIWNTVVDEGLEKVLVLEDDIDFESKFRDGLAEVLTEAETLTPTWDLIYAGRKRLFLESEPAVHGSRRLIRPAYSYWTLGYLLSNRGARKLLEADPFHSFLPVDEYFPILFGKHPQKEWAKHYPDQNLEVYSANPLLVFPTHYVGDEGWFSDTEPPPEVLEQIRQRKNREQEGKEQETVEKMEKVEGRQKEVKDKAVQRQIELMKKKMKQKSEL